MRQTIKRSSLKDISLYQESRMACLFWELRKKANSVCSTKNPLELFMFSLFWLSSAVFFVFIGDTVQELRTL